jgi:hypothetical protein
MILLLSLKKNFVKLALGNSEASYSVAVHSVCVMRCVCLRAVECLLKLHSLCMCVKQLENG